MTTPDPFEILNDHVPFFADSGSDPAAAAHKAAMYEEILMSTTTIDASPRDASPRDAGPRDASPREHPTGARFTPRESLPSPNRGRTVGQRVAGAVAAFVCVVIGATLIPFGTTSNVAVAAEATARTSAAESGSVAVAVNRAGPDGEPVTERWSFVFDGDDASYADQFGLRATALDGIGYINEREWISSDLYDRERLFESFSANLATTKGLSGLLALSDDTTVMTTDDGNEVISALIRVDAGPGETFDVAEFSNLPAGLLIAPQGNYDLAVTADVAGGFITEIAWTATGTRFAVESEEAGTRSFRESGTITYRGLNEPQTIVAPDSAIPAEGLDEWKLLDGVTRTTMQNLFTANLNNPGVCGIDTTDINLLLERLTPESTQVFEAMVDCLDDAGDDSAARGIETLIEHHR